MKYFLVNKEEFIAIGDEITKTGEKAETGEVEVNNDIHYSLMFKGDHYFLNFRVKDKTEMILEQLSNYFKYDKKNSK